ncbi:GerAB/ArcD/ProY family transporter [Paenibacillus sp. A3]|uniref:GerAB/ArcD/ProY family transporter n=1 Tax=Paenibacillus sp. A3 TaxID=1337054 RepID=UPI0006D5ACE7|nr:GerAB/ArcD/ProY family transporter [Paenibacillus sp. A3]
MWSRRGTHVPDDHFLFLFLVVFVSPQIKIEQAKPLLEHGITPVLMGVKTYIGFPFMELSIFLMILPYVKRTSGTKVAQAFVAGTGIGGLMLFVITAASILVLGPSLTARETYPSYLLAKKINVGDFLQRIEAFMAGIWFFSIYMKLIALGIAQLCRLKDYRPLLLPLGVIIFVYSLAISPNMAYMVELTGKLWTAFALTFSLLIPLVLLIAGSFRSRN